MSCVSTLSPAKTFTISSKNEVVTTTFNFFDFSVGPEVIFPAFPAHAVIIATAIIINSFLNIIPP